MHRLDRVTTFAVVYCILSGNVFAADAQYPQSQFIESISFDMSTLRNRAPGNGVTAPESDNWTITWADDDHQYTSFGDGIGFGTQNSTRGSMGVARIEGGRDDYSAFDVFKTGAASGGFAGKSLGILAVGPTLYMLRNGTGSNDGAFDQTEIYESGDKGVTWTFTGVRWLRSDFAAGVGFFSPTFLQFGKAYAGARDNFVYLYAPEVTSSVDSDSWNVQRPGRITLMRVPVASITDQASYSYFSGLDSNNNPTWSNDIEQRQPAFEDAVNGVMRTSVSYNAGLGRYFLMVQQVNRFQASDYHIGIYEAPEPWGPWNTVALENASDIGPGLNTDTKTVYWNFSNKWLSADGTDFVLVYTGDGRDEWGTVEGSFQLFAGAPPPPPVVPNPPTDLATDP